MAIKDAILDGFALNPYIRPLQDRYDIAALQQMEILRRANLYRARWWVLPDDFDQPIPAYDTFEYQIQIMAGAYLWGLMYTEFSGITFTQTAGTNGILQITDACTGVQLWSEYASGNGYTFFRSTPDPRGGVIPHILTQSRLILEPGLINVEISNRSNANLRCQLLLFFAEPCVLITDLHLGGKLPQGGGSMGTRML